MPPTHNSSVSTASTAELVRLAQGWRRPDGTTRVVPVVGSGLNRQAAHAEGGAPEDDWAGLLRRIAGEVKLPAAKLGGLPRSFIQQWEAIVRWHTVSKFGVGPARGETDLQKEVCRFLGTREDATRGYALYRRFAGAGFRDIISLNFDRRLALGLGCETVQSSVPEAELTRKRHGRTLFRYSPARGPHGPVRIWYPHGDSRRHDTLKLGVRVYGMHIADLDDVRRFYMQRWDACHDAYKAAGGEHWALPPDDWDDHVRGWDEFRSWPRVFMSAPLLFVGCGLGDDEWPLWWLINQRARQTAYLDQPGALPRPATVVLTAGGQQVARFDGDLCYIRNLHFATYDDLWRAVETALL